ncbi:MAG: hypothetical protein J6M43_00945 [Neisseriaceae bacterium]|nr:hypothetical protein [Neisseriaceae bacterium]
MKIIKNKSFRQPEICFALSFFRIGYPNKLSNDNLFGDCFAFTHNDGKAFRQPERLFMVGLRPTYGIILPFTNTNNIV